MSVLVVTYDHERFIAQALDSVLAQQADFGFEVIVSEDCSRDATAEIVKEYARRYPHVVKPMFSERNLNTNDVLARALRTACGRYAALLDGDDYWTSPRKLEKQVAFLERNPELSICFHNVMVTYEDGRSAPHPFHADPPKTPVARPVPPHVTALAELVRGNYMQTCSVMYRRDPELAIPSWYEHAPIGDWPLHVLHARNGGIGYIDEVLATYRVHAGGLWSERLSRYRTPADVQAMLDLYADIDALLGGAHAETIAAASAPLQRKAAALAWAEGDAQATFDHARTYMATPPRLRRLRDTFTLKLLVRSGLRQFLTGR